MRIFAYLTATIASLVFTTNAGVIKRTDVLNLAYVTGRNKPLSAISDLTGIIIEGRPLASIKRGLPIADSLLSPPEKSVITQDANTLKSDTKKTEKVVVAGEEKEEGEDKEEKEEGEKKEEKEDKEEKEEEDDKEEDGDKEEEDEEKKEGVLPVVGGLPLSGLPINEDLLLGEP